MDDLLEAYASSSSSDDVELGEKAPVASALGELPPELHSIFNESGEMNRDAQCNCTKYDLATERRRAEERAGNTQWVRRFPHERGNWPTHVFVPVPNSAPFKSMAEASVANFRQRLAAAWRERHGCEGQKGGKKRARDGRRCSDQVGGSRAENHEPPEVVMNDMNPLGQQHLSLSKTTALRAHHIEPFVQGLKEAVKSSRSFTASVVAGYDVLVNDDKTRSFVCLRVRGGRQMVLKLIAKVDPLMRRFKQAAYYKDPVVHVSVASVRGDVSAYVTSSEEPSGASARGPGGGDATDNAGGGERRRGMIDSGDDGSDEEKEEE
ncbi:unnamed protein product, partial [Pylaiella littoralis]